MPTPITKKGYDALKSELDCLRKIERPKVIEAIAEARAHGDLSENAEYDAAKRAPGSLLSRASPNARNEALAEARIVETAGTTRRSFWSGPCWSSNRSPKRKSNIR